MSNPDVFFLISIWFPSPPPYILADIEQFFTPLNKSLSYREDWTTHHLNLIDSDCPSTLRLSNYGIKIQSWVFIFLIENTDKFVFRIQAFSYLRFPV